MLYYILYYGLEGVQFTTLGCKQQTTLGETLAASGSLPGDPEAPPPPPPPPPPRTTPLRPLPPLPSEETVPRWTAVAGGLLLPKNPIPSQNFAPKSTRSRSLLCIGAPWARGPSFTPFATAVGALARSTSGAAALSRARESCCRPCGLAAILCQACSTRGSPSLPSTMMTRGRRLLLMSRGGIARLGLRGSPSPAICDARPPSHAVGKAARKARAPRLRCRP
jgi:hypothetical protein